MTYVRVIPRDLFNESKLLKCLGQLALEAMKNRGQFEVDLVERFQIEQNPADGSIFVANLPFSIGGRRFHLYRPLNSRAAWGLYLTDLDDDNFDVIEVFDDDGRLTAAFVSLLNAEGR